MRATSNKAEAGTDKSPVHHRFRDQFGQQWEEIYIHADKSLRLVNRRSAEHPNR